MEHLTWKIDTNITCPHCGHEECERIFLNAETSICNKCDKEFNIQLFVSKLEVRSTK